MSGFQVSQASVLEVLRYTPPALDFNWAEKRVAELQAAQCDAYYASIKLRLMHECSRIMDLVQSGRYVDLLQAKEIYEPFWYQDYVWYECSDADSILDEWALDQLLNVRQEESDWVHHQMSLAEAYFDHKNYFDYKMWPTEWPTDANGS